MKSIKRNTYLIASYELAEIEEAYANDQADTPREEIEETILEACIDICRERARLYCMPAEWVAKRNVNGSVTVTRYHY